MAIPRLAFVVVAALGAMAACDNANDVNEDDFGKPASITVSGDSVLSPEEIRTFTAEVRDENGEVRPFAVTWSVSHPTLASIDASGALSTTDVGTIYVIASADTVRDSVALRITASWRSVSVGDRETCAIDLQRRMWCWGTFAGTGQPANGLVPTRVASDAGFSAVAGGVISACGVVYGDGTAYCWGSATYNSLGIGFGADGMTPQPVTGGFLYDRVVLGREHGCGLDLTQQIVCWGKNAHGEVGDSIVGSLSIGHEPTVVVGGHSWKQVTAKAHRSCGLTTGGKVYCWGAHYGGVAGWPELVTSDVTYPVALEADRAYDALQMGSDFQCARAGVTLECWGNAINGQLGNGTAGDTIIRIPEPVSGDHEFGEFSTGEDHSCAIDTEGKAWCWGLNGIGHATLTTTAVPVEVAGNHRFLTISAGGGQSCGVTVGRALYCWGSGSLGDGVAHPGGVSMTPVRVRDP